MHTNNRWVDGPAARVRRPHRIALFRSHARDDVVKMQGDQRSVDELLNFIGGEGQSDNAAAKSKTKKKKGKKRGGGKAQADDEHDSDDVSAAPESEMQRQPRCAGTYLYCRPLAAS